MSKMRKEKSKIIETIHAVMPAVVSIVITKSLEELEKEFRALPRKGHKETLSIPPDKVDAHGMVQVGGGSGFLVHKKGIILTNKHVIAEPGGHYTVITDDNTQYSAEIVASDPVNDVAILSIPAEHSLPIVPLGNSSLLELGQTVIAFGNALGIFKNTVSAGIISGLSRAVSAQADPDSPPQEMRGLIQTDAAINPGNSGGPLVALSGHVVGINAAVVYGAQSIGFAIPINTAKRDLEDLERFGRIRRPLLGVRYLTVTEDMQARFNLPVGYGALVTKEHPSEHAVAPNGPADKAGIREGDIILEWNGEHITPEHSIQEYLEECEVGMDVSCTVLRPKENSTFTIKLKLTERK